MDDLLDYNNLMLRVSRIDGDMTGYSWNPMDINGNIVDMLGSNFGGDLWMSFVDFV